MMDSDSSSKMQEMEPEPSIPLVSLSEFEGGCQWPSWDIPNIDFLKEKHLSLLPLWRKSWKENAVEDLTLVLGTRKMRCNRFLLMCHSKYALRELRNGRRELLLPEDRVTWKGLELICEWIQNSTELLQRRHIVTLLSIAMFLEIGHLVKHIWYCLDLSDEFHEDQAFALSQEARELGSNMPLQGFDTAMLRRVRCFFLTLVSSAEFIQLSLEHVCSLLGSDELSVNSEKEVLFAAIHWLTHDWPSRIQHITAVLQVTRLPLLQRKSLIQLRQPSDDEVFNLVIAQPEYQKIIRVGYADLIVLTNNDNTEMYKLHCSSLKVVTPVRRLFICHDLCPYHRHYSDESLADFSYKQFIYYLQLLQKNPNSWKSLKAEHVPFTFN